MSKREAELKKGFTLAMKNELPRFYLLMLATAGAPDRVIVGGGKTTFWEFKHGTPAFDSPGRQELICMRLAIAGYCRYVVWQENAQGEDRRTLIVHPQQIRERKGWSLVEEDGCVGFDHKFLVSFIRKIHLVNL
jgi:hypothetical protein